MAGSLWGQPWSKNPTTLSRLRIPKEWVDRLQLPYGRLYLNGWSYLEQGCLWQQVCLCEAATCKDNFFERMATVCKEFDWVYIFGKGESQEVVREMVLFDLFLSENSDQHLCVDCPICLEPIVDDCTLLICDHYVHGACIDHATFKAQNRCPLCRAEVRVEEAPMELAQQCGVCGDDDGLCTIIPTCALEGKKKHRCHKACLDDYKLPFPHICMMCDMIGTKFIGRVVPDKPSCAYW
jgi:hypothetical protein